MLIVFRADANPQIGTGHVMRCLALAEALSAQGAHCVFLCRALGLGDIADHIRAAGHQLIALPEGPAVPPATNAPAHAHWLPHGWQYDAQRCRQELADLPAIDWLVVDHYALNADWERSLRPLTRKILVITDLADRLHECDMLLDANLAPPEIDRHSRYLPASCQQLLGPRHALLRPEFAQQRSAALKRAIPAHASRLLIMFGGADCDDLTGQTLTLLSELALAVDIDVVIGPLYPHQQTLEKIMSRLPGARLHHAPENIAVLMSAADLSIGSPGTTCWERCTLGLPSITIAVADNQEAMAQILSRRGAHLYLGRATNLKPDALAEAIRLLTENQGWRTSMRKQAADLCDGRGPSRVASQMYALGIDMQPATMADAGLIYHWRNDPRVRQYAFNSAEIAWEAHRTWFENALRDHGRQILLAQQGSTPVACVRFDFNNNAARVSIFLDPEKLGQGLSVPILRAAEDWLLIHRPEIREIHAEVLAENTASHQAFCGAGYRPAHSEYIRTLGATISFGDIQ